MDNVAELSIGIKKACKVQAFFISIAWKEKDKKWRSSAIQRLIHLFSSQPYKAEGHLLSKFRSLGLASQTM